MIITRQQDVTEVVLDAMNDAPDLTDILDQRDRDYCIAALRSRWVAGIDVCGAGGR